MARPTYVKKARKNHLDSLGNVIVAKGESYYWWKFRYGGKRISKTPPLRSQLTNSPFLSQVYSIEEEIESMTSDTDIANLEDFIEQIRVMGDECQDNLDNMPEQLQDNSESGQLLQSRIDDLESWASDLDAIDIEIDEELSHAKLDTRIEDIIQEIQSMNYAGE